MELLIHTVLTSRCHLVGSDALAYLNVLSQLPTSVFTASHVVYIATRLEQCVDALRCEIMAGNGHTGNEGPMERSLCSKTEIESTPGRRGGLQMSSSISSPAQLSAPNYAAACAHSAHKKHETSVPDTVFSPSDSYGASPAGPLPAASVTVSDIIAKLHDTNDTNNTKVPAEPVCAPLTPAAR